MYKQKYILRKCVKFNKIRWGFIMHDQLAASKDQLSSHFDLADSNQMMRKYCVRLGSQFIMHDSSQWTTKIDIMVSMTANYDSQNFVHKI